MQIEKALKNDHLGVSKVFGKFCIPTINNFAEIYPWSLLLSQEVAHFLTVSIVFSFYEQNSRFNNLKARTAMNPKNPGFVIRVVAIIYWLLYN